MVFRDHERALKPRQTGLFCSFPILGSRKNAKCPLDKDCRCRRLGRQVVPIGGKRWRWKYRMDEKEVRRDVKDNALETVAHMGLDAISAPYLRHLLAVAPENEGGLTGRDIREHQVGASSRWSTTGHRHFHPVPNAARKAQLPISACGRLGAAEGAPGDVIRRHTS